jgi:hypothetical protein
MEVISHWLIKATILIIRHMDVIKWIILLTVALARWKGGGQLIIKEHLKKS